MCDLMRKFLSINLTPRLRIAQRGSEAAILLINNDDGKLFAMSLIKDGSVERAKVLGSIHHTLSL